MCVYVFVCAPQNASYVDREDPDLPVCVEQTVLVWIPLGFLWLCAPRHLVSLCRRTQVNTKHLSKLYLCKQVMHTAMKRHKYIHWVILILSNKSPMINKSWCKGSKIQLFHFLSQLQIVLFKDLLLTCFSFRILNNRHKVSPTLALKVSILGHIDCLLN